MRTNKWYKAEEVSLPLFDPFNDNILECQHRAYLADEDIHFCTIYGHCNCNCTDYVPREEDMWFATTSEEELPF